MRIRAVISAIMAMSVALLAPRVSFAQGNPHRTYLPVVVSAGAADNTATAELAGAPQEQADDVTSSELQHGSRSDRAITVMTRNLYFGADLAPVIGAPSPDAFVVAVSAAYQAAEATDFPGRAAAIAKEIRKAKPMLVGLQEVAIWQIGAAFDPAPATEVKYDFLQLILDELNRRGAPYEVVAIVPGFDAESPTVLGFDVRLTVRDVLLARVDGKKADLKISNIQTGNYAVNLIFPTAIGEITFPRQWIAVDAKMRGRTFRFITTHLEAFAAPVRVAQAQELLAGPANTTLPTILVGDFNAQPGDPGDAAAILIAAGFGDVWGALRPNKPGFTCCQSPDLRNVDSALNQRIDLVLIRGEVEAEDAQLVGNQAHDKTASSLWPSDHAGLVAEVELD